MHKRRKAKWLLILAVGAVTIFLVTGIELCKPDKVGAEEVCNECHEEVVTEFKTSFHGRAWAGMGKAAGCESCHGSADKHQDDQSKETIITFGKGSLQSAAEQSQRCLNCHSTFAELAFWDISSHPANDVGCPNCHSIHKPRSDVRQPETCTACHRFIRAQINKRSHHPIIEGKVKCSDCHNPMGTPAKYMIRAENVNQLCYKCHPDKRGPFVYEHPPVAEDCTICHTPHGSRHAKLLAEKVPNLCQDCHDWSRHPGTPYDANTAFTGSSPSNRFFGRGCLNCHGAIHGSTSFENHKFTR